MKRETSAQDCLTAVLFVAGTFLGLVVFIASRCDSEQELSWLRTWDVIVGLIFAAAHWLHNFDHGGTYSAAKKNRRALARAACLCGIISVPFMLFQLFVWHARTTISPRTLAANDVMIILAALDEYCADHGTYPTTEQGLGVLLTTPKQRSDPYIEGRFLIDPWDRALQYRNENGVIRVWSLGRDGLSGTEDDIAGVRNSADGHSQDAMPQDTRRKD